MLGRMIFLLKLVRPAIQEKLPTDSKSKRILTLIGIIAWNLVLLPINIGYFIWVSWKLSHLYENEEEET